MSYTTDRYGLENSYLGDLTITTCGITTNHPLHSSGKRIYHDYSLHFISKGKGTYICNGNTYHLRAGEGFLIYPGLLNEYIGDILDPWEYVYIGFIGDGGEKILNDMGLNKENLTFSFPQELVSDLYAMHSIGKNKLLKGYGILGQFISIISHLVSKDNIVSDWSPEIYIKKAKRFIRDNYAYDINVENVASQIGIDRTYLYRLFLKYENTTPSKFILNTRLNEASEKLVKTDMSINEIALSSGFNDVSHFYKAFANKYKISPKKYRTDKR